MHSVGRLAAWTTLAGALLIAPGAAAAGYTLHKLHDFCAERHCEQLQSLSGLVADEAGNLYGTAHDTSLHGQAFELVAPHDGLNWQYQALATGTGQSFAAPLIRDTAGNLYGTNQTQVFEVSPNADRTVWTTRILYTFCVQFGCQDGVGLTGALTYAGAASGVPYDGISPLYGTASNGGTHGSSNFGGVVYQLTPGAEGADWTRTTLYDFCAEPDCADGQKPRNGVVVDSTGTLFGTTSAGGTGHQSKGDDGAGTVFELTRGANTWSHTVLYQFCSHRRHRHCLDGRAPVGVILDAAGNIFGPTAGGGALDGGTAYELTPDGGQYSYSTIHDFGSMQPQAPMTMDASGALFGTTTRGGSQGWGSVYKLSFDAGRWEMSEVYSFCSRRNCRDGKSPNFSTLVLDQQGNLFGTTADGGRSDGGTVFELLP